MPDIKNASIVDYILFQGGMPKTWQDEGGLWHFKHEYMEGSPEVKTRKSPKESRKVVIGGIRYDVAKLWKYEGKPCESQSLRSGGEGYDREK